MLAQKIYRSIVMCFILVFTMTALAQQQPTKKIPQHGTIKNAVKKTVNKKVAEKKTVNKNVAEKTIVTKKVADKNFPGQLTIEIFQKPTPMLAQNKYYLVYELHLTNYQPSPITLTSLIIKGDDHQAFKYSNAALSKMMRPIGIKNPGEDPLVIQAGMSKMIFVWLPFETLKKVPNFLSHEVTFKVPSSLPNITPTSTSEAILIENDLPVVIGTPLRGDYWIAGNAPSENSEHRNAHMILQARDYFAQRYAIDFVQIDKAGKTYHGNKSKNTNYFCYGKDVISVSPGRVIEVKNDMPENTPQSGKLAVPINLDTIGGNHIVIAIGGGKYAFYAHLIPNSIKVKVGDVVHQGQVIAKVGNTGNSSEPHLHFHIVNKPSFLAADGTPYLFDTFQVRPATVTKGKNDEISAQIAKNKPQRVVDQLVLENTVMKFAD